MRRLLKILGVILALVVIAAAGAWWWSLPPAPDAFYTASLPADAKPGQLLRKEDFATGVPSGARAWRILYVTTRGDGTPTLASAVVMTPVTVPNANTAPSPVIAWSHGTIGVVPACAPSLQAKPFDNIPAFDDLLKQGWTYVGSDYTGLGTEGPHPYLIGEGEARAELDAVRAARQIEGLNLSDRTVVWGHSQGGHAALWAGIIAPAYAPDVNVIGVAAAAPASDLVELTRAAQTGAFGRIVSAYMATAYSETYPDILFDMVVRDGQRWATRQVSERCLAGSRGLAGAIIAMALQQGAVFDGDPAAGALGARLRENTPSRPIAAPVLIQQGLADPLVLPGIQSAFVATRCASGQQLEYRTYEGLDHLSLVGPASPAGTDLLAWTRARFAGDPPPQGCSGDIPSSSPR